VLVNLSSCDSPPNNREGLEDLGDSVNEVSPIIGVQRETKKLRGFFLHSSTINLGMGNVGENILRGG
jgi:hypothetical protein